VADAAGAGALVEACAEGSFCPARTQFREEFPCPAGTRSPTPNGAASAADCIQCSAGESCRAATGSPGGTAVSQPLACPANAWCEAGDEAPRRCPAGTHVAAGGSTDSSACGACAAGHYCPEGVGEAACPSGTYQDGSGEQTCKVMPEGTSSPPAATTSATNCPAGSHSKAGATGCFPCPAGYACPGDATQVICGVGSYSGGGLAACATCVAGQLCRRQGMKAPDACPTGHYCPSPTADPTPAPVGSFSLGGPSATGPAAAQACHSGYTCAAEGAIGPHAAPCDAGQYSGAGETTCSATADGAYTLRGSAAVVACPEGYYCAQSEAYYPLPCPRGTYGAAAGLASAAACTACAGGQYCDMPGLASAHPFEACDEGYYCSGGSWTPRPRGDIDAAEGATGGACTAGHYCPSGSPAPVACPAGTYLTSAGMIRESDCLACPAGSYCAGAGSSSPTGTCQGGHFCAEGSDSATAAVAAAGHHAPAGSAQQIACPPGSYAALAGRDACEPCDAGSFCQSTGLSAGSPCPAGSFCPVGAVRASACLAGSYQPTASASASGACLSCPAGKVCPTEGLAAEGSDCAAGYICYSSAWTPRPATSLTTPTASAGACQTTYVDDFGLCPPGHHCAAGADCPTACPAGTYQPAEGATASSFCLVCPAGSHCDTAGLSAPTALCPAGYFCPAGSTSATANVCPPGYSCPEGAANKLACPPGQSTNSAAGGSASCAVCPAGTYCLAANTAPVPCPVNHYCPAGTTHAYAFPCPAGKSTAGATGATSTAGCSLLGPADWAKAPGHGGVFTGPDYAGQVTAGYLNAAGGATWPVPPAGALCPRGATCTAGAATACPAGQFCSDYGHVTVGDNAFSGACGAGHWCPEGATSPMPAGVAAQGDGDFCPAGYWCPAATTAPASTGAGSAPPSACPAGTYGAGSGLKTLDACSTCPAGFLCGSTAMTDLTAALCPAGSYCATGRASTADTVACSPGYACPSGAVEPVPCAEGTYQPEAGKDTCLACSAGHYCPLRAAGEAASELPCPAGHACPDAGASSPAPCAAGTFQDQAGQQACTACAVGTYCEREGRATPGEACPGGHSCPAGSLSYHENLCPPGSYCPAGEGAPRSCEAGKYCQGSGLAAPSGDCMAGYYCIGGASVPNPRQDPTGARCPLGMWCAAGQQPQACPAGTYNDKLGASSAAFCLACPEGLTCSATGLAAPTSDCPAGKYCVGTTASDCAPGNYCPAGEAAQLRCPPGSYQAAAGQASCTTCPAGSYCGGGTWGGAVAATECPVGFYCPAGTAEPAQYPCPAGRYGATAGLSTEAACTLCPETKHCNRPGLTAPTGTCLDGYYCGPGSAGATGGGLCPSGFYCTDGGKTQCPAGTQSGGPGAASLAECVPCAPGLVCPDSGGTGVIPCPEGRYCPGGAASSADADPAVVLCPAGSYCPQGSAVALRCLPGTYADTTGLSECKPCPVGSHCPDLGTTAPTSCPANRACQVEGVYAPQVCPPGTYAAAAATCAACPPGKFCWPAVGSDGQSAESCDSSYVCQSGSWSQYPYPSGFAAIQPTGTEFSTYNGPAFPGYRSDGGATNAACAPGAYSPGAYASACSPCPAGRYCPRAAMSSADAYRCTGGHLCSSGAKVPAPVTLASDGGSECPVGFFCAAGAYHAQPCPDGYQASAGGLAFCSACPEGYFCPAVPASWNGGSSATSAGDNQIPCPEGATCAGGVPALPVCDPGREKSGPGCARCPPGSYCRGGKVAGSCAAGFLCGWGQSEPNPWDSLCPGGSYCPHGTTAAPLCRPGSMSTVSGAR